MKVDRSRLKASHRKMLLEVVFLSACAVGCVKDTSITESASTSEAAATDVSVWSDAQEGEVVSSLTFGPEDKLLAITLTKDLARADGLPIRPARTVIVELSTQHVVHEFKHDLSDAARTGYYSIAPPVVCFSPDAGSLVALSHGFVFLHDLSTKSSKLIADTRSKDGVAQAIGFSSDGTTIVTTDPHVALDPAKQIARAWSVETSNEISAPGMDARWSEPGLSPDGRLFSLGGWPGPTPRIFDLRTRERVGYCFRDEWPVCVTFTPDSQHLATIHQDEMLVIWQITASDTESPERSAPVPGFDEIRPIAFSTDQKHLAIAKEGRIVQLRHLDLSRVPLFSEPSE